MIDGNDGIDGCNDGCNDDCDDQGNLGNQSGNQPGNQEDADGMIGPWQTEAAWRRWQTEPRWESLDGHWRVAVAPPHPLSPGGMCRHAVLCDGRRRGSPYYVVQEAHGATILAALLTLKAKASLMPFSGTFQPVDRLQAVVAIEMAILKQQAECDWRWLMRWLE